jgi:N-acetylglucosaminyldiphosphoundecaprenol N-acetyl-beta-D-mannosaminyltransferase
VRLGHGNLSRGPDLLDPPTSKKTGTPERVNVLGVGVSAISMSDALMAIDTWIARHAHEYVCVTGVHGVMESQRDPALRAIHNRAGLVTPDGMPLVWISRLRGHRQVDRVYGPDLMLACCEAFVAKGYRHFLYGSAPGVPERLAERLRERYPGMIVAGTCSPPFRELTAPEEQAMIGQINAAKPDIVWVGLSTPKQERWMARYVGRISAPVLIGVGAAFDMHAGAKKQAPRWMQRSGLEWLFRLATEPRRLWRRYLVNNPRFLWRIALQFSGAVRYDASLDGTSGAADPP